MSLLIIKFVIIQAEGGTDVSQSWGDVTRAAPQWPLTFYMLIAAFLVCHVFGGTSLFGSFLTTSPLHFVLFLHLFTMPPKPNGTSKRCKGVTLFQTPRQNEWRSCQTQPGTCSLFTGRGPINGRSLSSQRPRPGLATTGPLRMIIMIIDLTSRVQASEDQASEKAMTTSVSPFTFQADRSRAQIHRQLCPQRMT